MTNLEYYDLKHMLNTRRLQHYFIGLVATLCSSPIAGLVFYFLTCDNIASLSQYLLSVYIAFNIGLMITYFCDFWSPEKLDEMFRENRSYEDTLKSLRLTYKLPNT